jgi:uncharacterized protein YutE (UPF0331/DUF86 family)
MPKIDTNLLRRKIKLLNEDLAVLKNYKEISIDEYLDNQETQLIVERLLEKITGRLIDINYHILKEEYETLPEDYYNSFIEIGTNKIVTTEFAKEMAKSTGLRNALAHEYEEIDQNQIFDSIKTALIQIPQYLKSIIEALNL